MKTVTKLCCYAIQAQNSRAVLTDSTYNKQDTPGYQFTKCVSHSPAEHMTGLIMPQAMPFDLNGQHQGNALD